MTFARCSTREPDQWLPFKNEIQQETSTMNAQDRASLWLADFDAALQRRDVDAATALFADDACW
jgi:hypothetical protein